MEIHLNKFIPNKFDTYYSVGPLQENGIEKWKYTGDRYDDSREALGNMFSTEKEAQLANIFMREFIKLMQIPPIEGN